MAIVARRSIDSYPILSAGALTATLAVRETGPADLPKLRLLDRVREQHQADLRHGAGWVELPGALMRKYPNARLRHHLHESVLQRVVKDAVRGAGIAKPATCHTFRHSFAVIYRTTQSDNAVQDTER